jgi:hypothetical protein
MRLTPVGVYIITMIPIIYMATQPLQVLLTTKQGDLL